MGMLVAGRDSMIPVRTKTPAPVDDRHRKHTRQQAPAIRDAAALTRLVSQSLRSRTADLVERFRAASAAMVSSRDTK
jgi:hypothetical protein